MNPDLNLEHRAGLPDDLKILLDRYPREVWPGHRNLGETARFWLDRHTMFRELGAILQNATVEFREGALPARDFRGFLAPTAASGSSFPCSLSVIG